MAVSIEDLTAKSINDRISVCGENQPIEQPSIKRGVREKKRWLRKMLKKVGPPSKMVYVDDKPVGQIQYYPESSIPYLKNPDSKTLHIMCSFVHLAHQGKGHGSALFKSLVSDVKSQARYDRLETLAFDPPGCGLAQTVFWKHLGFQQRPDGVPNQLQYAIKGEMTRATPNRPKSVRERGVKVFYAPTCIFSHFFIDKTANAISELDPKIKIQRINMWEKPTLAKRRNLTGFRVIINGKPMEHSIFEVEDFKKEAQILLAREA